MSRYNCWFCYDEKCPMCDPEIAKARMLKMCYHEHFAVPYRDKCWVCHPKEDKK